MPFNLQPLRSATIAGALITTCGVAIQPAEAQVKLNYLQWFETEWDDIERRTPDIFLAGYDALWLPPPSKASFASVGYDPFDRFDLGQPPLLTFSASRKRTTYGTEATFQAMIKELQRSGAQIYIDGIFNHNGGRTTSDAFLAQGGYPGFWIPRENPPRNKLPTDDWGDFHNGNNFGYLQSENPGGSNYDLHNGDLVALVDIAQESNHQYIRQPVEANPLNIPAGTIFNQPDPNNARFYTDQALSPDFINNPGTSRNPGNLSFTRYPFNNANPLAGDPVTDNGTGMLMRWAQWMVEVQGIDGFRLDAHKHVPNWFWDGFFDAAIHNLRIRPDGGTTNPYTFGENISGNFDVINNQIRKDSFATRDSLDIQGAARLRDLLNANGLSSWSSLTSNTDNGHLDFADDGLINGTLGVNHVFSHDNGSVGSGHSVPPFPTAQQQGYQMHAYMLMRPGRAIVYHNGRAIFSRPANGFFPREGIPAALGWDPVNQQLDDTVTKLVQIRNQVGKGQYFQLNGNINDVLVFERAFNNQANSLTAVNDRFDTGFQTVAVSTSYPQGTRIHEMTGNAADPIVDPAGDIPETIVVGPGGSVTLKVPNNTSSAGTHGKGYVIYAESLPETTVTFIGQDGTIEPDPSNFPDWIQRISQIQVIEDDSFEIRVQTAAGDPLDPNTDDNAMFAFDARVTDWNGNGSPDIPTTALSLAGYEQFLTVNSPLYDSGSSFGLYRQTIDATQMDEGMHYLSVIAFRHRDPGTSALYREVRKVIYIDRLPPQVALEQAGQTLEDDQPQFIVHALDRTTSELHMLLDVPGGTDPLTLIDTNTRVNPYDRFEYRTTFDGALSSGTHEITIVAIEETGTTNVVTETITIAGDCQADLTGDGNLNFLDVSAFLTAFGAQDPAADFTGDGQFNFLDVSAFLGLFGAGCP